MSAPTILQTVPADPTSSNPASHENAAPSPTDVPMIVTVPLAGVSGGEHRAKKVDNDYSLLLLTLAIITCVEYGFPCFSFIVSFWLSKKTLIIIMHDKAFCNKINYHVPTTYLYKLVLRGKKTLELCLHMHR